MPTPPAAPKAPALVPVDASAGQQAVTILRQAADAAGLERVRGQRSLAAAVTAWIGRERQRAEHDTAGLAQGWTDVEVDLRLAATRVLLAVDAALHENQRRQVAYQDALAAWRTAVAAAWPDGPPTVGDG